MIAPAKGSDSPLPLRPVRMGPRDAVVDRRADGSILLRRREPLGSYPARLTERLLHWAERAPERPCLAQFESGLPRIVSYGDAVPLIRAVGQALLNLGLSQQKPLAILSENDIEHGLLMLAAMHVGVPCASISPSYSLLATDFAKLRAILKTIEPGLIYAADAGRFERAIGAAVPAGTTVAVGRGQISGRPELRFADMAATSATGQVDAAYSAVGPDTVARILCTSGSTGHPKAVLMPQRMICANQQGLAQAMAFLQHEPPVLVDWLPWHHTFGGTNNFGMAIYNGGSLYIDRGRPMPGAIELTLETLRQVSPTVYFSAPKGFEFLLPHLQVDRQLRESFFRRLKLMEYGGSTMPAHVVRAYDQLAVDTCGERIMMMSGIGSTEAGPSTVIAEWDIGARPVIGLPAAGIEAKLAPVGTKLELRLRGPSITPGYLREPERTRAAFDEEGFFCMGDAVVFDDPEDPAKGLVFDGRIAENFKLSSGTWVTTGVLRDALINAFAPLMRDAVIAGANRDVVTAIVFPNFEACRNVAPDVLTGASPEEVVKNEAVRAAFRDRLIAFNASSTASSQSIAAIVLEPEPPLLDTGELTDKNSISQITVLERRASVVEELYSSSPRPIRAKPMGMR